MITKTINDYRCRCGKLLFKGLIANGVVEIKCRRCRLVRVFQEQA